MIQPLFRRIQMNVLRGQWVIYYSFLAHIPRYSSCNTYWCDHHCGPGVTSLPLTWRTRVRSPVGSGFLIEVFSWVFLNRISLAIIIINNHSLWVPMTSDTDAPRNLIYRQQSLLPKGRSFTANSRTKAAVLSKGKSSTANSGTNITVLIGMNKSVASCCFPHYTLFLASEQTLKDLIRSQGPQRGGVEVRSLPGHSGLNQNSPEGLYISSIRVFDQIRDPEIPTHTQSQHPLTSPHSTLALVALKVSLQSIVFYCWGRPLWFGRNI